MEVSMNDRISSSVDAWLARNQASNDTAQHKRQPGPVINHFRLQLLPILLAISAVVVAAMWYQEERLQLINRIDHIGYPILLVVITLGAVIIKVRPDRLRLVMTTVFFVYVAHLLAVYYNEMANRLFSGEESSYELTIQTLWLPLGYVGSFVFFSLRNAVRTSLAIYLTVSLPQWLILTTNADAVSQQIAVAILISQPVYIAALWGVGILKMHASGIQELANSMSEVATVDALTGVANRRAMEQVLEKITLDAGRKVALMLLDVDYFKNVNDSYGHAVGDEVLRKLAHEASGLLRSSDLLGRWGGEEFMILALDQESAEASQMADRLRTELAKIDYSQVGNVTVSIGLTTYMPGEALDVCFKRADMALYRAKALGRNRVEGLFADELVTG